MPCSDNKASHTLPYISGETRLATWVTLGEPCLLKTLFLAAGVQEPVSADDLRAELDKKFGESSTGILRCSGKIILIDFGPI
ncbi:hypothetical protein ADUPG1_012588 [Aduncisulcus paluster]|uniref:Uncharacterized protein n=1 Tax=Aduncisulcus paluster TaxID=2918883 RepID=A0ABQ5K459_9EUKA|nr:hypothetical protein ADUPG1_012588 [Aduncisulcus paluster]